MTDAVKDDTADDSPAEPPRGRDRVVAFLLKRWFLVGLLFAIPMGFAIGYQNPNQNPETFARLATPIICTVLFLMALTLDSGRLVAALTHPKAVFWTLLVNVGLMPLMAWPLAGLQQLEDFRVGLIIISTVPCTMAAASVWTRRAGGNDAVSLLVTMITNGFCFAFTPFWLGWLLDTTVEIDRDVILWKLFWTALVPSALGQIVRALLIKRFPIDRSSKLFGSVAMGGVLVVIFGASMKAGPQIMTLAGGVGLAATLLMAGCAVLLHLTAAGIAYGLGRRMLRHEDAVASLFAGSQKTLPIGILIATDPDMLGSAGVPFAILPLLTFHALQLVIDTFIVEHFKKKYGTA